jgi:hypothetical protein
MFKQNLPAKSAYATTASDYINEGIFIKQFQHLKKRRSPENECLLIFDVHGSHSSVKYLDYS